MKIKPFLLFLFLAAPCLAQSAFDIYYNRVNSTVTGLDTYFVTPVASGFTIMLSDNLGAPSPTHVGTGLSVAAGELTITTKLVQAVRAQTDASGNYTWTYSTAFGGGVVPICSAIPEGGTTIPLNVQIVGTPSNTSVTFKVLSLPSTSVLGIAVLGAPAGAQAYLHLTAAAP